MNELAVYHFQNAYSEVLVNGACINKTGKRMGKAKNEVGGACMIWVDGVRGIISKRENFSCDKRRDIHCNVPWENLRIYEKE